MKLRDMRLEKDMTVEDVAEKCDITAAYVSKIERGICSPKNISFGIMLSLSRLYHIDIIELYDNMDIDHIRFLQDNIDDILNNNKKQISLFDQAPQAVS